MEKKCTVCGNTEVLPDGSCAYCVWRGDAGPGLALKKIIHTIHIESKKEAEDDKGSKEGST